MVRSKRTRLTVSWILGAAALLALASAGAVAQERLGPGQMMQDQQITEMPMARALEPTPFYRERTFLILLGIVIAGAGYFAYRIARSRWQVRRTPGCCTSEAVLVVDVVGSTHLATHYGKGLAMRAAELLHDRTLTIAESRGFTFVKSTGDGSFMTFPTVLDACETAIALLRDLIDRPPDLSPAPGLELRAGISYGEILFDGGNDRFGGAINKAFRLEGLSHEDFTSVEGENSQVTAIPDRNRIFLDEEAAQELQSGGSAKVSLRFLGYARMKGFSGLHRVYEILWSTAEQKGSEPLLDHEPGGRKLL